MVNLAGVGVQVNESALAGLEQSGLWGNKQIYAQAPASVFGQIGLNQWGVFELKITNASGGTNFATLVKGHPAILPTDTLELYVLTASRDAQGVDAQGVPYTIAKGKKIFKFSKVGYRAQQTA